MIQISPELLSYPQDYSADDTVEAEVNLPGGATTPAGLLKSIRVKMSDLDSLIKVTQDMADFIDSTSVIREKS